MNKVTIRVPATTANLGPGFDAFGCALSLYTDVTFEEMESGLEITGCDEAYAGPDNMAYTAYCAVLESLSEEKIKFYTERFWEPEVFDRAEVEPAVRVWFF